MKKNSSMQGTLNKLFGKKNSSTNSLYAENPPWMKPQGVKKTSVDYHDDITNSFSFLDDSGTATLKARPGPRARPVLQFSTSNTDSQGLAVPTPSVPSGYSENHSIGNGSKFNGNYRMYSSVGDLHLTNYYDYPDEEIPAPPSMPPPPPPTMIPAPPPQSALSDTSPVSPSLPDFIPPTPNSSATAIPNFEPSKDTSTVSVVSEQRQTDNISKWKSEGSKDLPMTLPNRFSLNSAVFQNSHGQTINDVGSHTSLPKTFKVPPPAPARTSSIQLQEHQNISYSVEPPPSPVPSSFNPSVQAKLYLASNPGKKNLDDTLNKRKSMIIMEDLNDLSQDHTIPRNVSKTDTTTSGLWSLKSTMNAKTPIEPDIERKPGDAVLSDNKQESESGFNNQKQNNKISINGRELPMMVSEKNTGGSKRAMSSIEINKMSFPKDVYLPAIHKNTKDTVKILSMKPIITDIPLSNTNVQLEQNSLARKFVDKEELTEMENDVKIDQKATAAIIKQEPPPTPPPMPPPPPPIMTPPKPPAVTPPKPPAVPQPPPPPPITPQKTFPTSNFVAPPPAPTLVASMPPVPQVSPLLAPKPKAISTSAVVVPPPAPPKAPPAPPPLPSIGGTSNPEPQMPFLKALQEKQQTLRQIPKKPIEIRPAQVSSIDVSGDEEQKVRVGKIKGELEALFSPKKDGKLKDLSSQPSLDVNKKSSNGNNLVNSLMMKVPHIPSVSDKEDIDGDTSEWIPKSNNTNFQIPEPDYSPISPTKTIEKPTYSDKQSNIPKPVFMTPLKPASPPKSTEVTRKKINDTPAYIPPPPKSTEVTRKKINDIPAYIPPSPSNSTEVTRIKINDIPAYKSSSPLNSTDATRIKVNYIPAYKPHNQRKASAENLALEKITLAISETPTVVTLKNDEAIPYPASSLKTEYVINQEEDTKKHPVTGERVEANSPMALLLAAKQRAQKGSRSLPLERSSLPKMSVSSGIETSPLIPQYNDVKTNTFVVVPKKEIGEQLSEEEVTSLSSKPGGYLDNASSSKWTDRGFISSKVNNLGLHPQNSDDVGVKSVGPVPTEHRNEDFWKFKSSVAEKYNSTDVPSFNDAYTFNISSVPSPVPALKTYEDTDYGIIPPPMEFMNTPPSTDIEMSQKDRSFDNNNTRSDLRLNYEWSNEGNRSLRSHTLSYNSDFNKQTFDNYNVGMNKDPQRVSLIKKRLYMPDPESSGTYGKSTHSLRTSTLPVSYSHMQTQSSSSMIPESRRTVNPSRYMTQGRRVSSENMVPSMNDGKYKPPNPEYGKSMSRPPNTYQQGMTFTVRPGTRQPISHMYQGGYL